jgi:SAM-dependent MidA family methyltransferase
MLAYSRPWLDAWVASTYGPGGFWWDNVPASHFRTASASTQALGDLVANLLAEHLQIGSVVDLGAGGGELLNRLADCRPDLILAGVDIRDRPPGLAPSTEWRRDSWDVLTGRWQDDEVDQFLAASGRPALITCVEWLDDLPCRGVTADSGGWREVLVDANGNETPGTPVAGDDLRWLQDWWPIGSRAEVGLTRDAAWASVLRSLQPYGGLALMIDYGHLRANRPAAGSLAGYRDGRVVPARPDRELNLTAAVAVDAVEAAGVAAGARTVLRARQGDLVAKSIVPKLIDDPLADLVGRSELAALRSPRVWGRQWWLLQQVSATGREPGVTPTAVTA